MAENTPSPLTQAQFVSNVGQLFVCFAGVETAMTSVLKVHLSENVGADDRGDTSRGMGLAAAIYGGLRFKAARDTMNRIMDVEQAEPEIREGAKRLFDHVGNIGSLRDKLAHHATTLAGDGQSLSITDNFVTRDLADIRTRSIATDALRTAANDLGLIAVKLWSSRGGKRLFDASIADPVSLHYKPSMLGA